MSKQDGQGGSDNFLVIAVLGAFLVIVLITVLQPWVERVLVTMAVVESRMLLLIHSVLPNSYVVTLRNIVIRGVALLRQPGVAQFKHLPFSNALGALDYPSRALLPLIVPAMVMMARHVRVTDIARRYRRSFDLDSFIKHMSRFYPHLKPIASVKLDELDPLKGPWRIKVTEVEFATAHRLLLDGQGRVYDGTSNPNYRAAFFDEDRCARAFVGQLGPLWDQDWQSLKPYQQALFGVFAAMIAQERRKAMAATRVLNGSFVEQGEGKFVVDLQPAIALASAYANHPRVVAVVRAHAYATTALSSMLEVASQRAGEYCSAYLIWLRPIDSVLYWALHQVGMRVASLEAAGIFNHRAAEEDRGLAIRRPAVTQAVDVLAAALVDCGWLVPDWSKHKGQMSGATAAKVVSGAVTKSRAMAKSVA